MTEQNSLIAETDNRIKNLTFEEQSQIIQELWGFIKDAPDRTTQTIGVKLKKEKTGRINLYYLRNQGKNLFAWELIKELYSVHKDKEYIFHEAQSEIWRRYLEETGEEMSGALHDIDEIAKFAEKYMLPDCPNLLKFWKNELYFETNS
ncbi:MAG: hypothetical protein LBC63_00820 [Holophagales bacterium]|nr:hypothetical protein [Holophagales bacterium]